MHGSPPGSVVRHRLSRRGIRLRSRRSGRSGRRDHGRGPCDGRARPPVGGGGRHLHPIPGPPATATARGPRLDSILWRPATQTALTDANGVVRLLRGEKDLSVVTVSAPGYLPQDRRNVRGTAVVFKLQPGIERLIRVVSSDRAPAAGAL